MSTPQAPHGVIVNFLREGEWASRSLIKRISILDPLTTVISTICNWFNLQSKQFANDSIYKKNLPSKVPSKDFPHLTSSEANIEHHEVDIVHGVSYLASSNTLNS